MGWGGGEGVGGAVISIGRDENFRTIPFLLSIHLSSHGKKVPERTVELQWLEYLWDHENMFETGVVRANEC